MAVREAEPVETLQQVREAGLDREDLLEIYRNMLITRGIEERGHILYKQGKIPGSFYTGRGNEGSAVGVATAMGPNDVGTPLQRDMGVHVTRGLEPWRIFAQYMGRDDGPTRGRDGNVHMGDARLGLHTMVSHLPAMLPVAVGMALAFRIRDERRVAVAWCGEGASSRGDAHEGMNFAGVRRLPVVFVIDNNQWAYSTPSHLEYAVEHLADRAAAYGFDGVVVDGTDVLAVYREAKRAIEKAREGGGPDADRVRHAPHGGPRGPRRRLLRPEGAVRGVGRARPDRALPRLASRQRLDGRRGGGRDHRAASSGSSTRPCSAPRSLRSRIPRPADGVFATPTSSTPPPPVEARWPRRPTSRRSRDGLRQEMQRDERVFVLGEDVGVYGGAFKVTQGFQEEFGAVPRARHAALGDRDRRAARPAPR